MINCLVSRVHKACKYSSCIIFSAFQQCTHTYCSNTKHTLTISSLKIKVIYEFRRSHIDTLRMTFSNVHDWIW